MTVTPAPPAPSRTFLSEHPRTRAALLTSATIVVVGLAIQMVASAADLTRSVVVPSAIAVLLAGLLMPLQVLLNHRLRLPRMLAAALTIVIALGVVAGIGYVAGSSLAQGIQDVRDVASEQLANFQDWLADSSLPLGREQIDGALDSVIGWLQANQEQIAEQAVGVGAGAAGILVGTVLCLVGTFFFLAHGDQIASWLIMRLPRPWQDRAFQAGRRGWVTIGTYTKTQLVVAAVDAVGIGVGAAILGVEFVLPLTAITFVLCFIPIIGAVISGALFVVVALAFQGFGAALIMLAIVVGVQQAESNLLSPLLMGKAVNIHPVVVLLGVATGTYLMGLVGALFAVPAIAAVNTMASYLAGRDPFPGLDRGRSALTDSPRRLVSAVPKEKMPKRVGEATPAWVLEQQARQYEAAHEGPKDLPVEGSPAAGRSMIATEDGTGTGPEAEEPTGTGSVGSAGTTGTAAAAEHDSRPTGGSSPDQGTTA